MSKIIGALIIIGVLAGCSVGPTAPKGQLTIQGRGAEALTNQGDPFLGTGCDEKESSARIRQGVCQRRF